MRRTWLTLALASWFCFAACGDEVPANKLTVDSTEATVKTGGDELIIEVPAGAESVALVVEGLGSKLLLADTITSPSGKKVFDFQNDVLLNETRADDQVYTVIIPNNPDVALEAGEWKATLFTDATDFEATVKAVYKTSPASAKALDLNLIFVGIDGLDAATAKDDEGFQGILEGVEEIYGQAGLSFGQVRYFDSTATGFSPLQDNDLNKLLATSGDGLTDAEGNGLQERGLNFFFVSDIEGGDEGFSLAGLSGGVPGPPGLQGTLKSGVVVNMTDFPDSPDTIKLIMAHEAGHFLGLYHTTERNGQALNPDGITGNDHLDDTPVCPDEQDANDNKSLSSSECEGFGGNNLMFFSPPTSGQLEISDKQGQVMIFNPMVR